MRGLVCMALTTIVALSAWPVAAQPTDAPRYGSHPWDGPWHGWFMGPVMMAFVLVLVIAVVIVIIRWSRGDGQSQAGPHHGAPDRAPLDILKERFAKGEIDKEEFEERRRILDE